MRRRDPLAMRARRDGLQSRAARCCLPSTTLATGFRVPALRHLFFFSVIAFLWVLVGLTEMHLNLEFCSQRPLNSAEACDDIKTKPFRAKKKKIDRPSLDFKFFFFFYPFRFFFLQTNTQTSSQTKQPCHRAALPA